MEELRNAHSTLNGKPEGKRSPLRPRRRCEVNIRMDLRKLQRGKLCSGFIWFRIEFGGGLM
jgi:hypothetical protein